jgi:hypothetical protein
MRTSWCSDGDMAAGHARAPYICMHLFIQAVWPFFPSFPLQLINWSPQTLTPTQWSQQAGRKSQSKCTLGKKQETDTEMAITRHFNFTCGFSFCSNYIQWMWPDYLNSVILAIITKAAVPRRLPLTAELQRWSYEKFQLSTTHKRSNGGVQESISW